MRTNEKNRSIIAKIIFVLIVTIMLFSLNNVIAVEFKAIEKSAEFEKWENLPEEEKKNAIEPAYTTLDIQDSMKKSTYSQLNSKLSSALESRYSLKDNLDIIVKNQHQTDLCWAFSFSSVLETTIAKQYNKESPEYSTVYTDYISSKNYNKKIGAGANFNIALANAVSGNGPVYESDMPFSSYYNESNNSQDSFYLSYNNVDPNNLSSRAKINKTSYFANIYKSYSENSITYKNTSKFIGGTTYTEEEVAVIRQQIKKHIKEEGAVYAAIYVKNLDNIYNSDTNSYYSNFSLLSSDHAITIIGWDDNYSKTNFKEENQPLNDGAYIVLNSWGDEFGDEGYFYISYEDSNIEQEIRGIDDVQQYSELAKAYDNLYQYDELGNTLEYYFLNNEKTSYLTSGYLANVFTRKDKTRKEYLSEVGVYIPQTEGIEVYVDTGDGDMQGYIKVASYTGTNALEPGYYDLKLPSPVEINGEKFAVVVKYINENGAKYSIECNLVDSQLVEEDFSAKASANAGESYISSDGTTWIDINQYQVPKSSTKLVTLKNTNSCIKAFTTIAEGSPSVSVTGVTLDNGTLSIEAGETKSLIATVAPSNATNKNVIWSSSNENIATVTDGVITAKAKGEATITVKTVDQEKIATCVVAVTEAEPAVIAVQGISINKSTLEIEKGSTESLIATVTPNNASNKNVTWSSSNEEIATVIGGVVTAKSKGEAIITVKTVDGEKTATCMVTVIEQTTVSVEKIEFDKTEMSIQVGDTSSLVITFNPSNASNKNVIWSSSDTNVATITERGIITAISEGKTIIKAISEDGDKESTCELTVVKKTNIDDDIYKDNNTDSEEKPSSINDSTVANKELPNTGITVIIIVILTGIILFSIIKFIKYNNLKDVK